MAHRAGLLGGGHPCELDGQERGRRITSPEVVISDEDGNRLCTVRITNLIVDAG